MDEQTPAAHPARRVWPVAFVGALALYVITLAPGPVWQDGGEVQFRVLQGEFQDRSSLARAHILYYLAAAVVNAFPAGGAAYKANLVAALFGAITVANVAWLVGQVTGRRFPAGVAALLLACSHTLWQFSTMAEVLTLTTALLSAELCLLCRFAQDRRARWLYGLALAGGLGLANHNFALLSLAVYLAVAVWRWSALPRPALRTVAISGVCWLVGASPLLLLFVRELLAGSSLPATIESLLWGEFRNRVLNTGQSASLAAHVAGYIVMNFPTPLLVLMPVGWLVARRGLPRWMWVVWTALFGVHFVFAARYRVADQFSFMIPSYVLLVLFAAWGIDRMAAWRTGVVTRALLVVLAALGPIAYALAPAAVARWAPGVLPSRVLPYRDPYAWFLRPWRIGDNGAARYARETLGQLPPDAVLLAASTPATPLLYVQQAEQLRTDVVIESFLTLADQRITPEQAIELAAAGRLFVTDDQPQWCPRVVGDRLDELELHRDGMVFRVTLKEE